MRRQITMPHLPRRTKQPLFHTSVRHHLKPRSIASASRGTRASPWYIMTRGTAWQAMLPRRSLGKITSFLLLYFLRIGLLHGMHVVLGWELNWLYMWWTVLQPFKKCILFYSTTIDGLRRGAKTEIKKKVVHIESARRQIMHIVLLKKLVRA